MTVLGKTAEPVPAVVHYVEGKCLLAGVTTSQGIKLHSAPRIETKYRGVVRNVKQTGDPQLPEADTRLADVEAASAEAFLARLKASSCLLLHLAEGVDDDARQHFLALQVNPGSWAIRRSLAGIHCAALRPEDFRRLARGRGSMVWSPLSNLLLYGRTADIGAARAANVRIALGSDWSPSGSKDLLGEFKIARLLARQSGWDIPDAELVAMATRNAAEVVRWGGRLWTLEPRSRADLLVVAGRSRAAHAQLLEAHEGDVKLVMIDGVARYDRKALMRRLRGARRDLEPITVGGAERLLFFKQRPPTRSQVR
jgi:5-methylthioadenosine/S-adenosylhomocysteine deaminase